LKAGVRSIAARNQADVSDMTDPESLPTSPEDVLLAALRARDAMQFERIPPLCDRECVLTLFREGCRAMTPITLDAFAAHHSHLADGVEPAYRAFLKQYGDPDTRSARLGIGVTTHAELCALDPADYLARRLAKDDFRTDLLRRLRERGRPIPEGLFGPTPSIRHEVIGSVFEPPDLTHVLYRDVQAREDEPDLRGRVEFGTVRRQDDGTWRLLVEDIDFLSPRGGTSHIVGEELADLWDDEELGGTAPLPEDVPPFGAA
jgi:hypothetical protein